MTTGRLAVARSLCVPPSWGTTWTQTQTWYSRILAPVVPLIQDIICVPAWTQNNSSTLQTLQQCKRVLFIYRLRLCTSKWMIYEIRRTVLLAFINCLVISTPQLKERNRLRNEFIGEFFVFNTWFPVAPAVTIWLAGEFIEIHNMLTLRRKLFAPRYFWCNVWVASILGSYPPNSGRWPRPVAIHPFSEPCAVDKLLCDVEILWNTLNTLNTLSPWVASRVRVSTWTSRPAQPQ